MKIFTLIKAGLPAIMLASAISSMAFADNSKMPMMDHSKMDHSKMQGMDAMKKGPKTGSGDLAISGGWARQSFGRAINSAGFMTIKNSGTADDMLMDASSAISKRTELHTHIKDGEIMRMRRVEGGIKIPKGGQAELKPGGLHVMFIGLKEPLKAGVSFPVTLKFKKAGEVTINLTAQKMAMKKGMDHSKMDHSNMDHGKMKMDMKK